MNDVYFTFPERKCETCGKIFIPAPEHRFKVDKGGKRVKWYCCWTCYIHREQAKRKGTKRVLMIDDAGNIVREFESSRIAFEFLHAENRISINGDDRYFVGAIEQGKKAYGYYWRYKEESKNENQAG